MRRQALERDDKKQRSDRFDLDELLHPAQAFAHPSEVVNDPDLTPNEKRAILASWASDACAVEAAQPLRKGPGQAPIASDEIMDALRMVDRLADRRPTPRYRRVLRERIPGVFGRKDQGDDQGRAA